MKDWEEFGSIILMDLFHNDEEYKLWNFDFHHFETENQVQNNFFELFGAALMIFWSPLVNKVSLLNKLD